MYIAVNSVIVRNLTSRMEPLGQALLSGSKQSTHAPCGQTFILIINIHSYEYEQSSLCQWAWAESTRTFWCAASSQRFLLMCRTADRPWITPLPLRMLVEFNWASFTNTWRRHEHRDGEFGSCCSSRSGLWTTVQYFHIQTFPSRGKMPSWKETPSIVCLYPPRCRSVFKRRWSSTTWYRVVLTSCEPQPQLLLLFSPVWTINNDFYTLET